MKTSIILCALALYALAQIQPAEAAKKAASELRTQGSSTALTAEQAYADVLRWASGSSKPEYLNTLYERIERASYRYNIIPEFALAVISAEAKYGNQISYARYESWASFQQVTGSQPQIPSALDDLDTAFSNLNEIMSTSKNVKEVLTRYWTGSNGSYNKDSFDEFSTAVSKLYFGERGLEKFVKERIAKESKSKYTPDYYNQKYDTIEDEPLWSGVRATGDLAGFKSKLDTMPRKADKLPAWPGYEEQYAQVARRYNKNLSHEDSIIIARAVLSYCYDIDASFKTVDPVLVMALVRAESNFKPAARSRVGALGLGQLMPATARGLGISNPLDPVQNLYGCVKYLEREEYRWRKASNKTALMLAAYNAGPGAVKKYGGIPPYKETKSYVKIVTKYYNEFKR